MIAGGGSISDEGRLPRRLGLLSASAVVIGTTIGSGIFRSPAAVADRVPDPYLLMSVWAAGGLLALCGALTLAEVASAFPRTGGIYVFIREAWGTLPAFLFGWAELLLIRAAALGAVATTFAEYALRGAGYDPTAPPYSDHVHYWAALGLVLLAAVNVIGVRWSALVLNLTTVAKYGALVFLVLAAAFIEPMMSAVDPSVPAPADRGATVGAFGLALVGVLWAYDGWADLSFVGGEVERPRRNLPRALIGGALAVLVIYLAANLAYIAVLPMDELRSSRLVAADVAHRLVGEWGVVFVGLTVVLSTFGTLNGSLLTSPRIFFALAEDGLFPRAIAAVHPRFQTPHVAILLSAGLGIGFVLMRTFEQLADIFVTAIVPFYALAVAAVFPLRRRADYRPAFRVPAYPVVPAIFVMAAAYLLVSALADPASRWPTVTILGLTLVGIPVYYYALRQKGRAGQ